jgi:omega-6 fatty acid desaturase (delta-12 desaturase)
MSESAAPWKPLIAPYAQADTKKSILGLCTSAVPYLVLSVVMWLMIRADVSYVWTLLVGVLAGGFLLRTFIVFHDCTHGSYMPTKKLNHIVGAVTGVLVYTPFQAWRHDHAMHHASAGDLDRRGAGDVETITVDEYLARDWKGRWAYRTFRNPIVMLGLGWIWALIIQPRIVKASARPRSRRSVWVTNGVLLVLVGGLCLLIGPGTFFMIQGPTAAVAGISGVYLFYVQHQFEDTYWEGNAEWSYADAALRGSSYLKLPKVLQFFSGNIGLHHVHHLSARVPNYNLQAAHDEIDLFRDVPVLTFWNGLKATRLKVWDPRSGRLLTWGEVRRMRSTQVSTA